MLSKEELYNAFHGIGPTRAEAEEGWYFFTHDGTIIKNPVFAFNDFWRYAEHAWDRKQFALYRSAVLLEVMNVAKSAGQIEYTPAGHPRFSEKLKFKIYQDAEAEVLDQCARRIQSLIPAIQQYVQGRAGDPLVTARLSWLIDKVATAYEQHRGHSGISELYAGLLEIAEHPETDPDAVAIIRTTATQGTTDRLKWKSSTAAFAHIFNTLAKEGYFDLPTKGGKSNDRNTAAFARMLLQAFDVPGKDGNPITSEVLRMRLWEKGPGQLAESKAEKIQIPDKDRLIVPNADEME